MNAINDADYHTPLREIDVRNIELRVEWTRRKQYRFEYPDMRGDITGPVLDQHYAMQRQVSEAILREMAVKRIRRKVWPAKVSPFLRRQAN